MKTIYFIAECICMSMLCSLSLPAQKVDRFLSTYGYPVEKIPDSLKEKAHIVIRDWKKEFIQTDVNNAVYKETKVLTILNKYGESSAHFRISVDQFRELKKFSGIVRDASGVMIKEIKKSDLSQSSLSGHLGIDDMTLYCNYHSVAYPFTIEYSYELINKKGIIRYPDFIPLERSEQSLEKAVYRIELPDKMRLRYNANYDCNLTEEQKEGKRIYVLSAENRKSMPAEVLAPYKKVIPIVQFSPVNFSFDSYSGNMETWQNYGLWNANLLKGRDVLPKDFIAELNVLVQDAKDGREKVKILYEYLQANTRYVSVQLGIGGFQPDFASNVLKMKFGDCKGLSNLMKAMLKAVGIASNYCIISTRDKDFYPEYANVSQDHAILFVPLENDSIWLECTSKTIPFGYIHDRIAGHDALIIHEDGRGGELVRLPDYPDELKYKTETKVVLNIDQEGKVDGEAMFTEYLHAYDGYLPMFRSVDRKEHISYIDRKLKFPKINVGQVVITEKKDAQPWGKLQLDFTAEDFVNKTQNRFFIPVSPFKKSGIFNVFSSDKRYFDIHIEKGGTDIDTVIFHIPAGYTIESMPKDVALDTPFGKFERKMLQEDRKVTCIQYLEIFPKYYDKSVYSEIKVFFSQITKELNQKLVARKV